MVGYSEVILGAGPASPVVTGNSIRIQRGSSRDAWHFFDIDLQEFQAKRLERSRIVWIRDLNGVEDLIHALVGPARAMAELPLGQIRLKVTGVEGCERPEEVRVFEVVAAVRLGPADIKLAHGGSELTGVTHLKPCVQSKALPLNLCGKSVLVWPATSAAVGINGKRERLAVIHPLIVRVLGKSGLFQQFGRSVRIVLPGTISKRGSDRIRVSGET